MSTALLLLCIPVPPLVHIIQTYEVAYYTATLLQYWQPPHWPDPHYKAEITHCLWHQHTHDVIVPWFTLCLERVNPALSSPSMEQRHSIQWGSYISDRDCHGQNINHAAEVVTAMQLLPHANVLIYFCDATCKNHVERFVQEVKHVFNVTYENGGCTIRIRLSLYDAEFRK